MQAQLNQCCVSSIINERNPNNQNDNKLKTKSFDETQKARLDQNHPNPFNSSTKINFFVPDKSITVSIMIFDMQGKLLKQIAVFEKGEVFISLSAKEFNAGMYMYSLVIDTVEIDTKRMILTQ